MSDLPIKIDGFVHSAGIAHVSPMHFFNYNDYESIHYTMNHIQYIVWGKKLIRVYSQCHDLFGYSEDAYIKRIKHDD